MGCAKAVRQRENEVIGNMRVHASFTMAPNPDAVNDNRSKYMVPDSAESGDSMLCVDEKDFKEFIKEGGDNKSLEKLKEKLEIRAGLRSSMLKSMPWTGIMPQDGGNKRASQTVPTSPAARASLAGGEPEEPGAEQDM